MKKFLSILLFGTLASPLFFANGLYSRDTTVIITEARIDAVGNAYVELTNIGNSAEQLSNYHWATIPVDNNSSWGLKGWLNRADFSLQLPDTLLQPGESFVISNTFESDINTTIGTTWKELSAFSDLFIYHYDYHNIENDSVSVYHNALHWYDGKPVGILFYGLDEPVIVDMVNGSFSEKNNWHEKGDVAGIEDATESHILIRKTSINKGNRSIADWENSRGSNLDNSQWIVIPHNGKNELFSTIDHHGSENIKMALKPKSNCVLNSAEKIIEVPWMARRGDSVISQFNFGNGMAWQYIEKTGESAYTNVRTGDTLRLYAVGEQLTIENYIIHSVNPPNDMALVVPKRKVLSQNYLIQYEIPYFVTNKYDFDTIGNIPHGTRADTLLKYLAKPENTSWKFSWKDGQEKADIKKGDILEVTSKNGRVTKQYYLAVNDYIKSDNAFLKAITWPGISDAISLDGFNEDTIPDFDPEIYKYHITLPDSFRKVPTLQAIPKNINAKTQFIHAKSLVGNQQERTSAFTVTSESGKYVKEYQVIFRLNATINETWQAEPFISQYTHRYYHQSQFWEIFNPGTTPIDLSKYMFVRGDSGQSPTEALVSKLNDFDKRYWHYIPGYKYTNDAGNFSELPMKLYKDPSTETIIEPGKTWIAGTLVNQGSIPPPVPMFPTEADKVHIHFSPGIENQLGETFEWENVWCWPERFHDKVFLFKIINDSITKGTKAIGDSADVMMVDAWWDADETDAAWDVSGQADRIANEYGWGFWRKSSIYKGNTSGSSFGTSKENSEWETAYWRDHNGSYSANMASIIEDMGEHDMEPVTEIISRVTAKTFLVDNEEFILTGNFDELTVGSLFSKLIKADENQQLAIQEKALHDTIAAGDILLVTSAYAGHVSKYQLIHRPLTSDARLNTKNSSGGSINVSINDSIGKITGVPFGIKVKSLLDSLIVPEKAVVTLLGNNKTPLPLQRLAFGNTDYLPATVYDGMSLEVMAADNKTSINYEFITDITASDAKVTSHYYPVNEQKMAIYKLPINLSKQTFINQIHLSKGAAFNILDKTGFERDSGHLHVDDVLQVISEDKSDTNRYHLNFMDEKNQPPTIIASFSNLWIAYPDTIRLSVDIKDDGLPVDSSIQLSWQVLSSANRSFEILDTGYNWMDIHFKFDDKFEIISNVNDGEYSDADTFLVDLTHVGIHANKTHQTKLFPNPANDLITVKFGQYNHQVVNCQIFDMKGQLVLNAEKTSKRFTIDVSDLPVGQYILKINGNSNNIIIKL